MIRATITLNDRELASLTIANIGGTIETGEYRWDMESGEGRPDMCGFIDGWDRRRHAEELVAHVLAAAAAKLPRRLTEYR